MQGCTPLHVAVFPKTHIKLLVDWSWTEIYKEYLRDYYIEYGNYSEVSKEMISCIQVTR